MNVDRDPAVLQDAAEAACRAGLRAGLCESDARDLAQDALVRALSTARPPVDVPLSAWVYGIAKNLGRDHAKSAKSREVGDPPEIAATEDVTTVLAVRHAIHDLPAPLRDVITLHELEEYSLRETALALGIPFDTAKDRLRRARDQLRQQFADPTAACSSEQAHTRRRVAGWGAAIVVGLGASMERVADAATLASATAAGSGSAGIVVRAWMLAVGSTALLVGGFAAGRFTAPGQTSPRSEIATATPPEIDANVVALVPADAAIEREPDAASLPTAVTRTRTRTTPIDASIGDAAAERLLLDRARSATQRGMPDEAVIALMSHAREFPTGRLAEERDVLLIDAYLRAGNATVARQRIERYRADYPTGALAARVTALESSIE